MKESFHLVVIFQLKIFGWFVDWDSLKRVEFTESLSPDKMNSAEPFSASSRNLLSLGSRHAVMVSTISIFMHSGAIRVKNCLRSSLA